MPAILEYIPYRKNDCTAVHDHVRCTPTSPATATSSARDRHPRLGRLPRASSHDEYLPLEQSDGIEVIRVACRATVLQRQVGMIGISWGGFNGLQIAAHSPPELGAVVSVCSTDDRYTDDVHYMGGCLLAANMLSWASVMLGLQRPAARSCRGRRVLAQDVARTAWSARRRSSRRGFPSARETSSGSRARCARTSPPSPAPSTWWAAGPTPTATPSTVPRGIPAGRARG